MLLRSRLSWKCDNTRRIKVEYSAYVMPAMNFLARRMLVTFDVQICIKFVRTCTGQSRL